jgi:hypothetical protein
MPIDPNIALGVRPVEVPNMLGQMGQMMQMRQAQQQYEQQNNLRDAFAQGTDINDPATFDRIARQDPTLAYKLKGQHLEQQQKGVETGIKIQEALGGGLEWLSKNPSLDNAKNLFSNLVNNGVLPPDKAQAMFAKLQAEPDKIGYYANLGAQSAITAQAKMQDATSRRNADVTSGPGYLQAGIAREKLTQEQKDRSEIDAFYGRPSTPPSVTPMGGGGGSRPPSAAPMTFGGGNAPAGSVPNALPATVGATPAAPTSPNMLRPDAQAPATTPISTAAPVGDLYDQIKVIDAQIAKLPVNNPKAIPIIQALNAQRTQLLASAKQQYGGNQVDMSIENPDKPGTYMTVKGTVDQYGVAQPLRMGAMPTAIDLSPNGQTINLPVARPAPRAGYQYNAKGEEVKIPQTGVPEGVRLKPDERWNETKQVVEQVPGSAAFIEQQKKHAKDLNAVKTTQTTTKWGIDRINTILDPKNKSGFEGNFGGFNAYITERMSGNTATVKSELDSLKSELKEKGLQLFRTGGSIGAITEKEWPILEGMIASLNPKLDEDAARNILEKIRIKFKELETLASENYDDQWKGTQYHKPSGANKPASGSGGSNATLPKGYKED